MYSEVGVPHINKNRGAKMFKKIELQQGVTLYVRKSDQFKTVNFAVKWKTALDEKTAAARAVLANILEDSNGRYPSQSALRNHLDDLYGAVLFTDVMKRGDSHIVSLNIECVNDEYLAHGGVLDDTIELMRTVIFDPNMENGNFKSDVVEREKKSVLERIRSQYDNKTKYAQKRMLELLRPNSSVSASSDGTEEAVNALTNATLLSTYESMIHEDAIDIYVVGDLEEDVIAEKLKTIFAFRARPTREKSTVEQLVAASTGDVRRVREQQEMKQGKLHLGFSTPIKFGHPDYEKMQVTNGIFGGFAHSKLFMNVREKESMAYYVSSTYASQYGLLYVMAGIDAELEEKAVTLIQEQLSEMQNGKVTDLELDQTKALLNNSITSAFDSARGQIEVFDQFKELDENFTAERLISRWEAVTKDDVMKMAKAIQLEIVYLLSGKEADKSE